MTVRGSFDQVIKPGGRMPKGKPYHAKPTKTEQKKDSPVKKLPPKTRKVAV